MSNHNHSHDHDRTQENAEGKRPYALIVELLEHVPFSVSAVAIGLIVAGTLCILGTGFVGDAPADHDHANHEPGLGDDHGQPLARLFFHLFHPAHMFFSAAATAAMFCRYERKYLKAIVVGLVGAIGICGVSDIAMPQVSLLILGVPSPWHLCVVEHPQMVLPFALIGVAVGIGAAGVVVRSTLITHSIHVFVSTMASIFYMVEPLGLVAWIDRIGAVFLFVVLAVMVPCCLSDIVFPLLMSKSGRERHRQEPHTH